MVRSTSMEGRGSPRADLGCKRVGLRDGRDVVEPGHDRIRETIVAQLGRDSTMSDASAGLTR